ncbi:MAG: ParB/RepB/Spo0J family partition protein [Actinobacteria bacterium]|nr:ParB/RepB/Spo0J family partition protein [Actinomycetota bacterium]
MIETIVPIKNLQPNPYNPRKTFNEDELKELAKSISELGLLQPLVVYSENGHYVVLCGDRRRQACEMAGLKEIPCREIDPPVDQAHAVQIALTENLQRADLSVAEEATAIVELIDSGAKRAAIAKAVGKSTSYIGQRYALGKYPDVLEAFVKGGEKDLAGWALVGKIEDKKVRGRVIKTVTSWSYGGPSSYKDSIESVIRLQKFEDLEGMVISSFVCEYENKKQHIEPCLSGYGADRYKCPQYAELDHRVRKWLGIKGSDNRAVCANDQKTCLEYKRQAEAKIRAKVEKVDKSRLLQSSWRWEGDKRIDTDMRELGDKACLKCKDCFEIPFDFKRGFEWPDRYCMAKASACFDEKKKAFDAETKEEKKPGRYLSREDLEGKTDEELQGIVLEDQIHGVCCEISYAGLAGDILYSRGFYPVPSLAIEWRKFEPPAECSAECICHADYAGENAVDIDCFKSCPHLNKEGEDE